MARNIALLALGVVLGVVGGAAAGLHADEDEIAQAAAEAHVDVIDLAGAVNTTGLPARTYLIAVGELKPPPVAAGVPLLAGSVARADCIIAKESGGLDIPNRQGSGATGPGQYFPSTWARHTALYRAATGYAGPLGLHVLADVRRVMAWILAAIPSSRAEWSVGGC